MTDPRSTPWLAIVLLIVLALMPVLYVLSIGPAIALLQAGYIGEATYNTAYTPLTSLAIKCPPLEQFLNWYASFFVTSQ